MDDATARALNRINATFYRELAAEFSASRENPWPGWHRLQETLGRAGFPADARVLDVGCGNARLGRFLAGKQPALRYTGVDASAELLDLARQRGGLGPAPELLAVDLVEGDLAAALGERRFDLAAGFGLLHHLPGRARRVALLSLLLERLVPGGHLAVTCWQLAQFERFRRRVIPWATWNEAAAEPIDLARLEPGDHVLPFGETDQPRYVHFAHENETAEILAELGANVIATWVSDGRHGDSNRYFVARAP